MEKSRTHCRVNQSLSGNRIRDSPRIASSVGIAPSSVRPWMAGSQFRTRCIYDLLKLFQEQDENCRFHDYCSGGGCNCLSLDRRWWWQSSWTNDWRRLDHQQWSTGHPWLHFKLRRHEESAEPTGQLGSQPLPSRETEHRILFQ